MKYSDHHFPTAAGASQVARVEVGEAPADPWAELQRKVEVVVCLTSLY